MNNKFVVPFNIKKLALTALISTIFTIISMHITSKQKNFITIVIMNILTLFLGVASISAIIALIRLILNNLVFKNEEKSLLVVDNKKLLINSPDIFIKQKSIEWRYIEDICVFDSKNDLFNYRNSTLLKNKIIAVEITQEFYYSLSLWGKITYNINKKLSKGRGKGYGIRIYLVHSDFNADEVLDEIYKYCFINIQ